MLARLARFSYRRRKLVVVAWIVFMFVAMSAGQALKGDWKTALGGLEGTDSQQALDLLKSEFPAQSGEDSAIVFGDITKDPAAVSTFLEKAAKVPGVGFVQQQPEIAPNGRIAMASFALTADAGQDAQTTAAVEELKTLAEPLQHSGGVAFTNWRFDEMEMPASEFLGVLAAIVVLLVAFGSLLAMGLPVATALLGIMIASSLIMILARFMDTPDFTMQVAMMIGIGVGIDYALFIVTRYRDALSRLRPPEDAVVEAVTTSGRAVLFAGCTVLISILGMLLMGLPFLYGMAVGTSIAVAISVAAALTLLPALLGFIGFNIDKLSVHRKNKVRTRISIWTRWADFVQRRPIPIAIIGFVVLAAAALPVFGLRLGSADAGNNPKGSTTRTAYDLTAEGFGPGFNGRMMVVADTSEGSSAGLAGIADALRKVPGVVMVSDFQPSPNGKAAIAMLMPATGPQDKATESLVHHLRSDVIPAAEAGTGLDVHIGGQTAIGMDFSTKIGDRLPIFIGAVLVLSFLLLLMVFRSVLVPLKAVIMNLLSIGAAYGVIVAVFQKGWGGSIVGVEAAPIEAWAPMMLFAIVFGLSMDYEVFLLSSVKEEYDATGDNAHAVSAGLAITARLITAAALIMVLVFGMFIFSDLRQMKLMGLGLAVAVAVDATIVRIVLVPATMELLGKANWWLPKWLDRILPHLAVEGAPAPAGAPVPAPASAPSGRREDDGDADPDAERIGAGQR
ncbi:MAG TPA: MMPL family transporter [Acidimicrobiia bacterium]|nr:MMPL family transporter [Acidimicrobiia bacterium]